MARISTNTTIENLQSKFHFDSPTADKETRSAISREPDFAELHALYEIHYEQFLNDTSIEISKCTQKLRQLESIVYGEPYSE